MSTVAFLPVWDAYETIHPDLTKKSFSKEQRSGLLNVYPF